VSSIYIIVFAKYYVAFDFFAKYDKRFKAPISIQLLEHLYIDFLMRLSLFLKHSCDNLNINNNIKFVIQIKTHFV